MISGGVPIGEEHRFCGFVVVDCGRWQIDGGFCHGLVMSCGLGWLDTTVSGADGGGAVRGRGLQRGKRGRRQR